MKKLLAVLAIAVGAVSSSASTSFSFEPCGYYAAGLALGPSWVFRNRLPTPPYFSIYSPVYYGEQYERPYGISPFAVMPEVAVPESYRARLKSTSTTVVNSFIPTIESVEPAQSISAEVQPVAVVGESVWIDNPFVSTESGIALK